MRSRTAILATALLAGSVGTATAIPYASGIRPGHLSVAQTFGTTINYTLNHAAATVTIEIRDSLDVVQATFAGTTAAGLNSVPWDGTNNNAGGTPVATGTGYRIRVAVTGTEAAGWVRIKAQGHANSNPILGDTDVVLNWFCKGLVVNTDPNSDFFGSAMVGFGYGATLPAAAVMELRSDLEVKAGDNGLASRILRHSQDDEVLPNPTSYTVWGMYWDQDVADRLWYVGQPASGDPEFFHGTATGGVMPQFATNANAAAVRPTAQNPRGYATRTISGTKYGFICRGNAIIDTVTIDGAGQFATYVGNILSSTGMTNTTARYSKNVRFNSAGDLYWGSQRINTTVGSENGKVYRWSAANLAAAIAAPGVTPLTEANADLIVINNHAAVNQRVGGFAINPVDNHLWVFTPNQGAFDIGDANTTTGTVNLASLTAAIPGTDFRSALLFPNAGTSEYWFDAVGNLYHVDGSGENAQFFSPGGAASNAFTAPPSQSFQITTSVPGWEMMMD